MSKKGYKQTKEHRKKISKALKKYLSKTDIKRQPPIPWGNKNTLGKHWKLSEETKRKISKTRIEKKLSQKEKNPFWKGGLSFEPYGLEFDENLREVIRNRDKRKCQICEKTELEERKKLSVHHIDYNKKNNNPDNLITLCKNCHHKTNFNRDYWIKFFTRV